MLRLRSYNPRHNYKVRLLCPMVSANQSNRNLPIKDYQYIEDKLLEGLSIEEKEDFLPFAVIATDYTYKRYLK